MCKNLRIQHLGLRQCKRNDLNIAVLNQFRVTTKVLRMNTFTTY